MSDFIPVNDLDRAIMALQKSKAAWPDFYRAILEGELWFPVHYHPEIEEGGGIELQNGSNVPFPVLEDKQGRRYTVLFSSDARYDESAKKCNVSEKEFMAGAMPAKQILEILGKMEIRAQINPSCSTGNVTIPPDLMRDLVSGEALRTHPLHSGKVEKRHSRIVPPSEFPTDLVQPAFELLRKHAEFRAAFVLTDLPDHTPPGGRKKYVFAIIMDPEDEALFHDLNMVIATGCAKKYEFALSVISPEEIGTFFRAGAPFFRAPDYQPPTAPSES